MDMGTKPPPYDPWSTEYPNLVSGCCPPLQQTTRSSATYSRPEAVGAADQATDCRAGVSSLESASGSGASLGRLLCYFMRCDGYRSPPTQPKPRSNWAGLSPVQCNKRAVFASAQADTSVRLYGFSVCSAEFLISYPHQCGSFSPKTTKRMDAITACDLYRDGRHSVEYNFIFGHASIWHGFRKNARTNRIILTIIRPRCRDRQRGARLV